MENAEEKIKAQNMQITDGNTTIESLDGLGGLDDLIPEELTNDVNQDISVPDETLNAWNNTEAGDATDMETAAGDVTEQATNAGDERAADGGALRSKFNSRDGSSTNVESDLRDTSFGGGNTEEPQEQIPTELLNPVGTTTPADIRVPEDTAITEDETEEEPINEDITVTEDPVVPTNPEDTPISEDTIDEPVPEDTPISEDTIDEPVPEDTPISEDTIDEPISSPVISIVGSTVTEANTGEVTGNKVVGTVNIALDKPLTEKLTVTLSNNQKVEFEAGDTSKTVDVETSRIDDAYKQGTTSETISIKSTSNSEIVIENKTSTITIQEDKDPVNMTITATVTTPKVIDVDTKLDGSTGVKVTGINSDGKETNLSIIKGTNHDGFGIDGKNLSNGDTKELGIGEKIVVEFTDGKDVNSLDVSFAWRNNNETAKLTFIKDDKVVGHATVDGDGKSTTKAIVKYFDASNEPIKEVNAKGSSDKVDEAFTFELPASKEAGADLVAFDKVEFSAPKSKDDYLIHEIKYKEVLDPEVTDIITDGGKVTFNIQMDENYPPQGKATASVEINGTTYNVELNATGRGTVTLDSKELGDLGNVTAEVKKVTGGNYEDVNLKTETFDFTPTLKSTDDSITTDEDVPYTLTINDFGDISESTKEFKITEVPTNGKLTLSVTTGETIVDNEGNQTTVTQDSKVEIVKDQIITLGQVGAGKVEFVPNKDSDEDGQFKFQVGDGEKFSKTEYETEIIVNAVADAPDLNIELTKMVAKSPELIEVGENLNASQSNGKGGNKTSSYKVDLGEAVNSVNVNVSKVENGEVRLFNGSTIVGNVAITSTSASYSGNSEFTSFEVVNLGGQGKGTAAFKFEGYSYESTVSDKSTYEIEYSAKLTDTDGSEKLSDFIIKNLPEGSELFGADKQENGTYTVEVDETGKAKLTLESKDKLSENELNSIKASATSTENSNGDSATTTVSQSLGKDIDLSGLTSILEEQKTGDIDLSKNGSQDELTPTFDDVLELSDDGKIKITGDEFDSVNFKNTTSDEVENKGQVSEQTDDYTTYINTEDLNVQVKVEQPISDGITC